MKNISVPLPAYSLVSAVICPPKVTVFVERVKPLLKASGDSKVNGTVEAAVSLPSASTVNEG